jgi:hypothetical protein
MPKCNEGMAGRVGDHDLIDNVSKIILSHEDCCNILFELLVRLKPVSEKRVWTSLAKRE